MHFLYDHLYWMSRVEMLKRDKSAIEALAQINSKGYAEAFKMDGKTIIKIGANFSSTTRRIDEWIIEMA